MRTEWNVSMLFSSAVKKQSYGDKWTAEKAIDWRREVTENQQLLNLNDVWAWATADCYRVPDEELAECAELAWHYGWAGILYFVSSKTEWQRSEFHDNNRMIDFVKHEEEIRRSCQSSSELAYKKAQYTIGVEP